MCYSKDPLCRLAIGSGRQLLKYPDDLQNCLRGSSLRRCVDVSVESFLQIVREEISCHLQLIANPLDQLVVASQPCCVAGLQSCDSPAGYACEPAPPGLSARRSGSLTSPGKPPAQTNMIADGRPGMRFTASENLDNIRLVEQPPSRCGGPWRSSASLPTDLLSLVCCEAKPSCWKERGSTRRIQKPEACIIAACRIASFKMRQILSSFTEPSSNHRLRPLNP